MGCTDVWCNKCQFNVGLNHKCDPIDVLKAENDKLRAEVERFKQGEDFEMLELKEKLKGANLQIEAWVKEVREAIRLMAVCGDISRPFKQQMGKLYEMLPPKRETKEKTAEDS